MRRLQSLLTFGSLVLLITPASLADEPSTAKAKGVEKVFVGYLFGSPREINFSLYTHLCHAFLTLDEQGNVKGSRSVPSKDLTADAHKAGVKVLLSLGGWGWDKQFAAVAANPEAEDRYYQAVMKLVDETDYDGIDLDWEYPDTKDEVTGFERLTRRFRKGLDELGAKKSTTMFVTMAASANPGTLKWLSKEFLEENMDWINVMTYDFTGDWTDYAGHHSPLFGSSKGGGRPRSTESSMKFLTEQQKISPDKLAVGIPLYGRGFPVAEPYASTKGVPKTRVPGGDYRNIVKLIDEQKWTRQWDDETKNPWLIAPDHSKVIGYDDAESVGLKTAWAMKQGFRGVFFWQIGSDRLPDKTNPLQEASHKAWKEGRKENETAATTANEAK